MNPKNLEGLMVFKQAFKDLLDQWEMIQDYTAILAKARRAYYLACLAEGFTASQALSLAAQFQFLGMEGKRE